MKLKFTFSSIIPQNARTARLFNSIHYPITYPDSEESTIYFYWGARRWYKKL